MSVCRVSGGILSTQDVTRRPAEKDVCIRVYQGVRVIKNKCKKF